jgi:hypothetical protein
VQKAPKQKAPAAPKPTAPKQKAPPPKRTIDGADKVASTVPKEKQNCPFCSRSYLKNRTQSAANPKGHSKHFIDHVHGGGGCLAGPESGRPPHALGEKSDAPPLRSGTRHAAAVDEALATRRQAYNALKHKICSCEMCQQVLCWPCEE